MAGPKGFADIKPRLSTTAVVKAGVRTVTNVVKVSCPYGCGSNMTLAYDPVKDVGGKAATTKITKALKEHMISTCVNRPATGSAK